MNFRVERGYNFQGRSTIRISSHFEFLDIFIYVIEPLMEGKKDTTNLGRTYAWKKQDFETVARLKIFGLQI